MKRTLYRTMIVLTMVVFSFLFIELSLTIAGYGYSPITYDLTGKSIVDNSAEVVMRSDFRTIHATTSDRIGEFGYHPSLLWRPKNGTGPFNDQGYIGDEIAMERESYVIIAFGDSNTAGYVNPSGEVYSWPSSLQAEFASLGADVLVVNGGIWGYSSYQIRERIKESLAALQPDEIIISSAGNDAHPVLIPDHGWMMGDRWSSLFSRFKLSELVIEVLDQSRIITSKKNQMTHRVPLHDYERILIDIIDIAQNEGIEITLLTRPYQYYPGERENPDPFRWKTYFPPYDNATRRIADERSVRLIDVHQFFENRTDYFTDESHLSGEGYRLMAQLIFNETSTITR